MLIKTVVRKLFAYLKKIEVWSGEPEKVTVYAEKGREEGLPPLEVVSVWDILRFRENTQACHLNSVIGFEEWIDMEEILRRIRELFGAEYKNLRSLYPYLKTLADIGIMETTSAGGRRKWRKVALFFPFPKKDEEREKAQVEARKEKKEKN